MESKILRISGLATNAGLTELEIEYQMLVIWLRKQIITQKLVNLKKKLTDHNHDK